MPKTCFLSCCSTEQSVFAYSYKYKICLWQLPLLRVVLCRPNFPAELPLWSDGLFTPVQATNSYGFGCMLSQASVCHGLLREPPDGILIITAWCRQLPGESLGTLAILQFPAAGAMSMAGLDFHTKREEAVNHPGLPKWKHTARTS